MKKLTNESREIFVAQYWGQRIGCTKFLNGLWVNDRNIKSIKYLELTPLQNISDEHADYLIQLEMGNWSISLYEKLIIDGNFIYFTPIFAPHSNKQEMINLNRLRFDQYQYLQSRGYAIPFYCPIENRIIPVQEQIDNRWITLKIE